MEKFENSLIIFVISRERGPKCLERIDPISVLSEDVMEHGTTSLEECQLLVRHSYYLRGRLKLRREIY